MFKILNFIILALIFTGCNFKPETPQISANFRADYNSTDVNDFWWRNFNDENLNELVESALKNNADLLLALNNLEYTKTALGLAGLEFLPNFNATGEGVRQNNFGNKLDANPQNSYNVGAVLSYEIDLWGKVRNNYDAAKSNFKASEYDFQTARLSIASGVVTTYFTLLSLKEQEKILSQTLQTYSDTANYRKKQLDAGAINSVIYYQSLSQVQSAKSQLISVQNQISSVKTALSIMCGKSYDEILHENIKFTATLPEIPEIKAGIPSDILLHRADVAAALERLKASNFLVGVSKANYFPTFSLTGFAGYASTEFNAIFNSLNSNWNIAGSLVMPLLDFGRTKKRVDLANLDQNASFIAYDKALKVAFGDVKDALNSAKNAKESQKSLSDLVEAQNKVYEAAKIRFDQGYSDYIELLDAERGLLGAKISLSNAKLNHLNSIVGVYKALGGGFEVKDESAIKLINTENSVQPNMSAIPYDSRIF